MPTLALTIIGICAGYLTGCGVWYRLCRDRQFVDDDTDNSVVRLLIAFVWPVVLLPALGIWATDRIIGRLTAAKDQKKLPSAKVIK